MLYEWDEVVSRINHAQGGEDRRAVDTICPLSELRFADSFDGATILRIPEDYVPSNDMRFKVESGV